MSNAREQILTSDVLARFVVGDEGHEFHVVRIIKERGKDDIYYQVGLPNLNLFASLLKMEHRDIGFGGKVQRFLDWDARITGGGGSLSNEFQPTREENEATFSIVQAMLDQINGVLYWDII